METQYGRSVRGFHHRINCTLRNGNTAEAEKINNDPTPGINCTLRNGNSVGTGSERSAAWY